MCNPVMMLGASLAMSAGQAVMGYQAQKAQYNAQIQQIQQMADASAEAAAANYSNLNIRAQQEGAAHAQEAQAREIERARAVASAEVAAAEGNVSGLSVDGVIRDIYAQHGRNESTADANLRMSRDYLSMEMESVRRNAQNQVNSVPVPEKPSFTPFLLQGFASGLNAYSGYYDRTS